VQIDPLRQAARPGPRSEELSHYALIADGDESVHRALRPLVEAEARGVADQQAVVAPVDPCHLCDDTQALSLVDSSLDVPTLALARRQA
jgi:hypothetical protein